MGHLNVKYFCILFNRMKFYKQMADALGAGGDEGRGVAAISFGEALNNL